MKAQGNGFSLIEVLIVIAVIGVIALVVSPDIINSLETRNLENSMRDLMSTMERAKHLAIKTKLNHRVRFDNSSGEWTMRLEQEISAGTWERVVRSVERTIPTKFNLTLNLPTGDPSVTFNPMGIVINYDETNHSIVLQSGRLDRYGEPDQREVVFYLGGSMRFVKSSSG